MRCSVSEGFSHQTLQLLLFFRNGHSQISREILHFNFSWLVCECYPRICVLLSWVSEHSHGRHPERRAEHVRHESIQQIWSSSEKSSLMSVRRYLSEFILSVATGSASFFSRSHMWRWEAASRTQKTVGLVWAHCSETTGSPAVPFFHSATGCSWLTACSLMLPSPQPTWSKGRANKYITFYIIVLVYGTLCILMCFYLYEGLISMLCWMLSCLPCTMSTPRQVYCFWHLL